MRLVMKLVSPVTDDTREFRELTRGETYFAVGVSHENYRLIPDDGRPALYPKYLFDVVDRGIPAGWRLDEEEGAYYLGPIATSRPGFYEDWYGSDPDQPAQDAARDTLKRTLEIMQADADDVDRAIIARDLARLPPRCIE